MVVQTWRRVSYHFQVATELGNQVQRDTSGCETAVRSSHMVGKRSDRSRLDVKKTKTRFPTENRSHQNLDNGCRSVYDFVTNNFCLNIDKPRNWTIHCVLRFEFLWRCEQCFVSLKKFSKLESDSSWEVIVYISWYILRNGEYILKYIIKSLLRIMYMVTASKSVESLYGRRNLFHNFVNFSTKYCAKCLRTEYIL